MKRNYQFFIVLCVIFYTLSIIYPVSAGPVLFKDERFKNDFTTENLNRIIEDYELYDGWYWTTEPDMQQDYHGHADAPGWTESAAVIREKHGYLKGWYGCRWMTNRISRFSPGSGGYGECFGFAQFLGYLLSGEKNPHGNWNFYYSISDADGLKVGDILRVEYSFRKKPIQHSAMVYAVYGDEIVFIQVSSSDYNRISIGQGFSDGCVIHETSLDNLKNLPGLKVCRAPVNDSK